MKTVLIANRKGGCGKTMVAVTVAAALAHRGFAVGLADSDRQKSALRWLKARPEGLAAIRALDWTNASEVGEAPKKLDWLVIDAPGALGGSRAEALIAEAEAVISPVQPSSFDSDSTRRFLREIEEIKRVRKGRVRLHLVANRVRTAGKSTARLQAFFDDLGIAPLAWISDRAAYPDLAEQGMTVFDRPQRSFVTMQAQWEPILTALTGGETDGSGN